MRGGEGERTGTKVLWVAEETWAYTFAKSASVKANAEKSISFL